MAVDRSLSLHPTWDRMYLSDMTVREISEAGLSTRSTLS